MKEKEFIHALQKFVFEYEKENKISVIQFRYEVKESHQMLGRDVKQLEIITEIQE